MRPQKHTLTQTEELEKLNREDTLTPLDARNSLLLNPNRLNTTNTSSSSYSQDQKYPYSSTNEVSNDPANPYSGRQYNQSQHRALNSIDSQTTGLMVDAQPLGRSLSPAPLNGGANTPWAPGGGNGYRGMTY